MGYALIQLTSFWLSQGKAEGESGMSELCRVPNARLATVYNLCRTRVHGFECIKCGLCPYLTHTLTIRVCTLKT